MNYTFFYSYVNSNWQKAYEFYANSNLRKWLFKKYVARNKFFTDFINKNLRDTVVGFGDFSQSSDAKYTSRRGPIKYLKMFLVRNNIMV